ncbi:hypothetical protein VSP20_05460 [Myroides phaeus]|uniref:hypothetical protein n=1 Tax=Myroides phaeus TaxID=702745 RepID=UPI002DBDF34E|nr:hypothetical protein [Myroides phaeus]MEC4116413.1 hypothetical protein [Myroides phaeus]
MKHINYIIFFFFALFLGTFSMSAQSTKIQDESIAGSSLTPVENSILELESTSKGFLMPRMTNKQRDDIPLKDKIAGNGLTIYNTDTDCINYWSTTNDRWMSLCGTLPPSIVNVDASNCNSLLLVNGRNGSNKLMQGEYLTPSDILYVNLTVGEVGHYDITAVTDNGYYFSGSGTFNSKGSVRIPLTGVGVPIKGGVNDAVKFSINGKVQVACSNFKIEVERAGIDFDITSTGEGTAQGKYYWNTPVDQKTNFINVNVNVKSVGAYTIKTTTTNNGVSYSGSGVFTKTGTQTVKLLAEGTPKSSSKILDTTFDLVTNSNGTTANTHNFKVKTTFEQFKIRVDWSKTTQHGAFVQGQTIPADSYLILEVEVLAPPYNNRTISVTRGGFKFEAEKSSYTFNSQGNKYKIRYRNVTEDKTLPNQSVLTLEADGSYYNSYDLKLSAPPIHYTIDCSSLSITGTFTVDKEVQENTSYAEVTVNATTAGQTTIISENEVNGLRAYYSGNLKKGDNKIKIKIIGKPKKVQNNVKLRLFSADIGGPSNCFITLNVREKIRDFNILVVGNSYNGPTKYNSASYKILKNKDYFGPSGQVKVKDIKTFQYSVKYINTKRETDAFTQYLEDNEIDMIFVVNGGWFSASAMHVLENFIRNNGVVVYSNHSHLLALNTLIENLTLKKPTFSDFKKSFAQNIPKVSESPILKGPFKDLRGYNLGSYDNNSMYWYNLPETFSVLATSRGDSDNRDAWAAHSNIYGLVIIGDGSWMNDTNSDSPFRASSSGSALPRYEYRVSWSGFFEQSITAYNSYLFANIVAWGIKHRQEN